MRGLDPAILFGGREKDARVKPAHDERGRRANYPFGWKITKIFFR